MEIEDLLDLIETSVDRLKVMCERDFLGLVKLAEGDSWRMEGAPTTLTWSDELPTVAFAAGGKSATITCTPMTKVPFLLPRSRTTTPVSSSVSWQ